ncbi:hypothetical protein CYLTODRAFT_230767 [Cylindrobasidium torrendii FP15055 ss-10]|uniref:Uncharacterized protein n=1 Tax=Cylindrobasidium torrendii FP15055 ss-10 TaxID=1314674 RepID=A0A0D7BFQ1_9AGAR|nr:hypothetical protein CYLTODRAFT_230767 [Cylindrobasidium torrendii FP15055 ss-10]
MDVDEEEDDSTPEDESLKCAGPSVDPEINFVVDNGPREMDVEGDSRNMEVLDVVLGKIARLEQSVEDDIRKAQMKKNELRMLTQDVTELQKAHECNKRRGEEYARRLEQNRGQREKYEKDIAVSMCSAMGHLITDARLLGSSTPTESSGVMHHGRGWSVCEDEEELHGEFAMIFRGSSPTSPSIYTILLMECYGLMWRSRTRDCAVFGGLRDY